MGDTKRTHFNPAFWTAHWSPEFVLAQRPRARDCKVHALFRPTGAIAQIKVENVHFENGLGRTVLPVEAAKMIVDRDELSEAEVAEMLAEIEEAGDIPMDFEAVFNSIESSAPFDYLEKIIGTKRIERWEEKIHLCAFLALQHLRHPRQWNALMLWRERIMGKSKWESFAKLMHPQTWREVVGPFADKLSEVRWNMHVSGVPAFPISDRTIIVNGKKNRIWTPLSPTILLEICLDQECRPPNPCVAVQTMRKSVQATYLKLLATQADSMIVFSDAHLLQEIARNPEFCARHDPVQPTADDDIWQVLFPIRLDLNGSRWSGS